MGSHEDFKERSGNAALQALEIVEVPEFQERAIALHGAVQETLDYLDGYLDDRFFFANQVQGVLAGAVLHWFRNHPQEGDR